MTAPIRRRIRTFLFHGGQHYTVSGFLAYDVNHPYAVALTLNPGTDSEVLWTFGRELLHAGGSGTVGDGDVQVRPVALDGQMWRQIRLTDPQREGPERDVLMHLDEGDVDAFVRQTRYALPFGAESVVVQAQLDAREAQVLAVWPAESAGPDRGGAS